MSTKTKRILTYIAFLIILIGGFIYGLNGIYRDEPLKVVMGAALLLLSGYLSNKADQLQRREDQENWDASLDKPFEL